MVRSGAEPNLYKIFANILMNNDKKNYRVGKSTNEMKSLLHNQTSKIEENMAHAFSLLSPLKSENVELKNKILAT